MALDFDGSARWPCASISRMILEDEQKMRADLRGERLTEKHPNVAAKLRGLRLSQ